MIREKRSIFSGIHEVDTDRVLPRIAAGAVFDLQLEAAVFLVVSTATVRPAS
jgi:hypothetical protein